MACGIRLAQASDADQMLAIYAPIVRDTAISFELLVPTLDEFRERPYSSLLQCLGASRPRTRRGLGTR